MGTSGCVGKAFLLLNFIFWVIGLGVLGYGVWILVTTDNASNLLSGKLVFTYSFLGVGLLIAITGLIGCIAGCAESTCCLKAYIGLMTTLLLIDIGVIAAGVTQQDQVFGIMDNLWDEINNDTKNHIQTELNCCGYSNYTEYGSQKPESCYEDSSNTSTLYTSSCKDAMQSWVKDNIPLWASVIAGIGLIQIISTILSCKVLGKVEKSMQVSPM